MAAPIGLISTVLKKIPAANACLLTKFFRAIPATWLNGSNETHLKNVSPSVNVQLNARHFSSLALGWRNVNGSASTFKHPISKAVCGVNSILSQPSRLPTPVFGQPSRNHIKFSFGKAKQKTVKPAIRRFFRLHWGAWIRPKCGRAKKLWKKNWRRKQRLRRHVFCNSTQNQLLNHMVTKFWKKPKYYVDDPYEPYHVRHGVYRRSPHNPM